MSFMTAASLQVAVHGHNAMACLHAVWLAVSSCSQPLFSPCGDVPLSLCRGWTAACVCLVSSCVPCQPPVQLSWSPHSCEGCRRATVLLLTSAPRLHFELIIHQFTHDHSSTYVTAGHHQLPSRVYCLILFVLFITVYITHTSL